MWVAGIDYSTHAVDVVIVPLEGKEPPRWRRHELTGKDAFDRTRTVDMRGSVWDEVVAVGIEHPGGKFGTRDMTRVQGAIIVQLPSTLLVHPLPPAKWRKLVGLPGNASKADVESQSLRHIPKMSPDGFGWPQDAHDAHCIALATRTLLEREKAA